MNKRKRVVITGSSGLVGTRVVELLEKHIDFIPLSQQQVDITKVNDVRAFLSSQTYDSLLHLAAYTNVDGAEEEKDRAYEINTEGTRNLLEENGIKPFIYISTGFVFSGNNPPYYEDAEPHPISIYGKTKYEGEKIVSGRGMIVRIEYPYRTPWNGKMDFVSRIRELIESGQVVYGITDSTITPTFIDDITQGLLHLINAYSPEIYHLVGKDSLSPFEAAVQIAEAYKLPTKLINPITYDVYFKQKAQRPRYATIKSSKNNFYPMKSFREGLRALQKINK